MHFCNLAVEYFGMYKEKLLSLNPVFQEVTWLVGVNKFDSKAGRLLLKCRETIFATSSLNKSKSLRIFK